METPSYDIRISLKTHEVYYRAEVKKYLMLEFTRAVRIPLDRRYKK
jgi:hypothetical protein